MGWCEKMFTTVSSDPLEGGRRAPGGGLQAVAGEFQRRELQRDV